MDQKPNLCIHPHWDADVVLTFPNNAKETTVLWFKNKIESIPGIILKSKSLSTSGKCSKSLKPIRKICHAFYIKATYECYLKGLDQMHIPKLLKDEFGGGNKEFSLQHMNLFKDIENFDIFLNSQERQSILEFILNRLRAQEGDVIGRHDNRVYKFRKGEGLISRSIHKKIIHQIFPVHDPKVLSQLKQGWIHKINKLPPIDGIYDYFGSKIALYFAWLNHYTFALAVHVFVGVLFWIAQDKKYEKPSVKEILATSYNDINFVLFSFFNIIWATIYLKSWKRRSIELTYSWRTLHSQKDLLIEPQPLFKGEERLNEITGRQELFYPSWKRQMIMCFISFPVILTCLSIVFLTLIFALWLQEWWDDELTYLSYVPKVFLATSIPILNHLYEKIATKLNHLENHRSEESHNNNLIVKLIFFQFINSFLALFYFAFYLGDFERLKKLLTAILITRQVVSNIKETVVPYAMKHLRLLSMAVNDFSTFDPSQISNDLTQIEREASSPVYKGTHEDYMEIFIQFGYVTFFSSIYPLAGILALLNNIFEIRGDTLKLCIAYQRPFGDRVSDIGVWKDAMKYMGVIAIIVNCALIGRSGIVFKLWPDISHGEMIFSVVLLEHLMLLIKLLMDKMISDIPIWVEKELTKIEHQRQEHERQIEQEK